MVEEVRLWAEIGENFSSPILTEDSSNDSAPGKRGFLVIQNKSPIKNPVVELLFKVADELTKLILIYKETTGCTKTIKSMITVNNATPQETLAIKIFPKPMLQRLEQLLRFARALQTSCVHP